MIIAYEWVKIYNKNMKKNKYILIGLIVLIVVVCTVVSLGIAYLIKSEGNLSGIPGLGCYYNDKFYYSWETFKDKDDCNTCSCSGGQVICTMMYCEKTEEIKFNQLYFSDGAELYEYDNLLQHGLIFRDEESWTNFKEENDFSANIQNDFTKNALVLIVADRQNTGGYSIFVNSVTKDSISIKVEAIMQVPGDNCFVTDVITQPYAIISIENTDVYNVELVLTEQSVGCEL